GRDEPSVTLAPWDLETAMLFAHRRSGPEGIRRVEAAAGSPAKALLSCPRYAAWILDQEEISVEDLARHGALPEFIKAESAPRKSGTRDYYAWSKELLRGMPLVSGLGIAIARLYVLDRHWPSEEWGRVFRAFLLADLLRVGRAKPVLRARLLEERDL